MSEPNSLACPHLGSETGESVQCPTCRGDVRLALFKCDEFGACTLTKPVSGVACCRTCELNPRRAQVGPPGCR